MIRKLLTFLALTTCSFAQERVVLFESGPMTNRVNIVLAADGYTVDQKGKFLSDMTNSVSDFVKAVGDYRHCFNIYGIWTVSKEAGADFPDGGVFVDTAYNSTFGSGAYVRLLYSQNTYLVQSHANQLVPGWDVLAVQVNSSRYGGSGGGVIAFSTEKSAKQVFFHELLHNYARLGDEYTTPYPGYPDIEEPNTTRETNRVKLKWLAWVKASTPIPTGSTNRTDIGLFEGAHYHAKGWYRPKYNCIMRTLGSALCEVCNEAFLKEAYLRMNFLESRYPQTSETKETFFSVAVLVPEKFRSIFWKVDGIIMLTNASSFTWSGGGNIEAVIRDNNPAFIKPVELRTGWTAITGGSAPFNLRITVKP